MSEYEVIKAPLRLKGENPDKKKKKKKKDKKRRHSDDEDESKSQDEEHVDQSAPKKQAKEIQPTKAELKFQKMQENVQKKRILKLASMTHKQRVEEFNKHLDSLTEHFDIPKVSWTK